jgi:GNAT superfamily N-acetyltransferase
LPGMEFTYQWERGIYTIRTAPDAVDMDVVHEFLSKAPWASGLTRETLIRALRYSLCFSLFEGSRQIGLARVISDYTTYAYLCDVYVVEPHRGRGLGSWLIRCILDHPDIGRLKRIALVTHDAQDFYLYLGFHPMSHPDCYMERLTSDQGPATFERTADTRSDVDHALGKSEPLSR